MQSETISIVIFATVVFSMYSSFIPDYLNILLAVHSKYFILIVDINNKYYLRSCYKNRC